MMHAPRAAKAGLAPVPTTLTAAASSVPVATPMVFPAVQSIEADGRSSGTTARPIREPWASVELLLTHAALVKVSVERGHSTIDCSLLPGPGPLEFAIILRDHGGRVGHVTGGEDQGVSRSRLLSIGGVTSPFEELEFVRAAS